MDGDELKEDPRTGYNYTEAGRRDEVDSEPSLDVRNSRLPMRLKRAVKLQEMQSPGVAQKDSWNLRKDKFLHKFKNNAREYISIFYLWDKSIQQIGGNFGGGVQSFFSLLRFLVVLNFCSFLMIAAFVIIPSIITRSNIDSPVIIQGKENCTLYDPNPGGLVPFYNYFLDVLSGTGFFENTYLFYGFYKTAVDSSSYNIPVAYIFTAISNFIFCLICITVRMGSAMRVAVETGGSSEGNFREIVFTSWDFGCLGDRATELKQKNISNQLRMELEAYRRKKRADSMTLKQKILLYFIRVVMFLFALSLIGGAFVSIFFATDESQASTQVGILGLIYEYLPSIVITAGNFVVPMMCDQIALLEQYSPSITVIVALLRAVFLRLVSLGILLYTLWNDITCSGDQLNCTDCGYNFTVSQCWETSVGQEMYKLALFDFLSYIAALVLVGFPRRMVVDNWSNKLTNWVGRQKFEVPSNLLGLVYDQTVAWTGAFFCPLLPLIITIKFFILFYCQRATLFYNCQPEVKTFRTATSTFVFLVVLLFGGGLATVVLAYSLSEIHPSYGCGPFRVHDNMWLAVPLTVAGLPDTSKEFFYFIGSKAFAIPLLVITCVVMLYFIALASVYGKSVDMLRDQLKLKKHEIFLVKELRENTQTPTKDSGVQD